MTKRKRPEELRSHRWLGVNDLRGFGHRARLRQGGFDGPDWVGKPVIGIINTWSDINPATRICARAPRTSSAACCRPAAFRSNCRRCRLPKLVKPSTMLYRNLLAMETEELLRSHPIDGAVLMGGCDKTTPGLIMGAISMGMPAIYIPAGPKLRGNWHGQTLGSGSDAWKYWDEKRAGRISRGAMGGDRRRHRPHVRHLHGDGHRGDHDGDRRDARPHAARRFLDPRRRQRVIRACAAIPAGASSTWCGKISRRKNCSPEVRLRQRHPRAHGDGRLDQRIIHLVAMARRAGIALDMARFDELSREIPVLANVRPSGSYSSWRISITPAACAR